LNSNVWHCRHSRLPALKTSRMRRQRQPDPGNQGSDYAGLRPKRGKTVNAVALPRIHAQQRGKRARGAIAHPAM
jgi:hypothetical protein